MRSCSKECSGDLLARQLERLVIKGYRGCMAGHDSSDVSRWEPTWSSHIGEVGPPAARCLMGERLWPDPASFAQALKRSGPPLYQVTSTAVESIAHMQIPPSANMTSIN